MAASAQACNLGCDSNQGVSLQPLAGCQSVSPLLQGLVPDGGVVTCKSCCDFIPEKIDATALNIVLPLSQREIPL